MKIMSISGAVLFDCDAATLADAVALAVKNGASLSGAANWAVEELLTVRNLLPFCK